MTEYTNDVFGLQCALKNIHKDLQSASEKLHDTGDVESQDLDDAVVAVDKAKRLIESLISK